MRAGFATLLSADFAEKKSELAAVATHHQMRALKTAS